MDLHDLVRVAAEKKASDIFIKANTPPMARIHGLVTKLLDGEVGSTPLNAEDTRRLAHGVMTPEQIGRFEQRHELDIAFEVEGVTRIRANINQERGSIGLVCRLVPIKLFTLEELGHPPVLAEMVKHRQGLILVTGPTGSGKSTTLAAMVNQINETRPANIITIEDPIEFVHPDKSSIVYQREVGIDTDSFTDALKYVMRQNPDVILVGELRDVETMDVALKASETGHLVLSTLHTSSAAETLDRIINMYPPNDKAQLCLRLSVSMRSVISQKLLPRSDVPGRVAGLEIMVTTPTVAKLLEEGRSGNVYTAIQEGSFWGMQTMNQCLLKYYRAGVISEETALAAAGNVTELRQMMRRPA